MVEATGLNRLFAYGSLRLGADAHSLIAAFVRERQAAVAPGVLRSLGEYPALFPGKGWVLGDVFTLSPLEPGLAVLDAYEGFHGKGHPENEYLRRRGRVWLADGRAVEAWLYVGAMPFGGEPIWDGDWCTFQRGLVTVATLQPEVLPGAEAAQCLWPLGMADRVYVAEIPRQGLARGGGGSLPLLVGEPLRLRTATPVGSARLLFDAAADLLEGEW